MDRSEKNLIKQAGRGGLLVGLAMVVSACSPPAPPPEPPPTPTPTPVAMASPTPAAPTPTPTPFIPRQRLEVSRLFNDIEVRSRVETQPSDLTAAADRALSDSYQLDLTLKVRLPVAAQTLEQFAKNDPRLVEALPGLAAQLSNASVSPAFDRLYEFKVEHMRRNLGRLDLLLNRHNFFDCDTILELENPENGAIAVLSTGDMDVNTDGSDGDRNFEIDGSSQFFQPQTSYRWRKLTDRPNQFLQSTKDRLAKFKEEYAIVGLPAERNRALEAGIKHAEATLYELDRFSFLISGNDPYIVMPTFMFREMEGTHAVSIGDYAVVVYDGVVYPAIVGDAGPSFKFGEASVRLCEKINSRSSAFSRPVSSLRVAYIVFPGTADKPSGPPDLDRWYDRCAELLAASGLSTLPLHRWESLIQPWPTPTPEPTPVTPSTESANPTPSQEISESPPATTNPTQVME